MKPLGVLAMMGAVLFSASGFGQAAKLDDARQKGLNYLAKSQHDKGYWSTEDFPGLTGLVVQAFLLSPGEEAQNPAVEKGLNFIRQSAKEDGGIYNRGMSNYNTSIALSTLLHADKEEDSALIDAARDYLVGGQKKDAGENTGGYGYEPTGKRSRPDLDNTVFALEALALYREKHQGEEIDKKGESKLDWNAAIDFVTQCQNLPATNKADWASDEEKDRGGFTYSPNGGADGTHSYGSMSYSGLLSLVHAQVDAEDERVQAVIDWLGRYFSVEENPGQGKEGLYYYYFVMAKALAAAELDELPTKDGKSVNWRDELQTKLLSLQREDGSWVNENGRWMEQDPILVTSYAVLALNALQKSAQ